MFRSARVRVPKARLSLLPPYTRQPNQDEHTPPCTLSSITRLITTPTPEALPSSSFLARLISYFNLELPSWPLSKPPPSPTTGEMRKRDTLQSQNVTIGAVVGVVLAIFLVALFYFLYRYNSSIRLKRKRKKRPRTHRTGSGSSKGSTSSTTTQGPGPPEPAGV